MPSAVTRDFLQVTEQFINDEVPTASTKARYQIALLAELQSAQGTIHPREFAERYFSIGDRMRYIDTLQQAGIPIEVFDKDTALVESRLRQIRLDFESGLIMMGTPENLRHVHMRQVENNRTHVEFEDRVKRVEGRGRKKHGRDNRRDS